MYNLGYEGILHPKPQNLVQQDRSLGQPLNKTNNQWFKVNDYQKGNSLLKS